MIIFLKKLMLKPLNQISSIMIVIPKSFYCPLSNRSTIKLLMIIMIQKTKKNLRDTQLIFKMMKNLKKIRKFH